MNIKSILRISWIVLWLAGSVLSQEVRYVIHISVDGGGSSYIQHLMNAEKLPNFKCFQTQGACTFNARTDYDYTITLPDHTTQLTGRAVLGVAGHNWTTNTNPASGQTIHSNKGSYVASVFDVVHDNGLRTAMYSGKTKFSLYDISYDAAHGAADTIGVDNGRDKIDTFVYNKNSAALTATFIADMQSNPFNFAFIHYADPDVAGHGSGWACRIQ